MDDHSEGVTLPWCDDFLTLLRARRRLLAALQKFLWMYKNIIAQYPAPTLHLANYVPEKFRIRISPTKFEQRRYCDIEIWSIEIPEHQFALRFLSSNIVSIIFILNYILKKILTFVTLFVKIMGISV